MVSDDQVKISDFGLARQYVENQDYYKSKGGSDLPVYWLVWCYLVSNLLYTG